MLAPPIRALYWVEAFLPYTGGTEMVSGVLLRGLSQRGHQLVVVTDRGHRALPDEDTFEGVPVHRFPFQEAIEARDPARLAEIRRRVVRLRQAIAPDLVHVHAVGPSLFFHLQAHRALPRPWLFTPHTPLGDQATGSGSILGAALECADWVACVSAAQRASILRLAPEVARTSSVIHWGLDPPALVPAPLPFAAPRLLCYGRHVPDKGFDVAVGAFARVASRFPALRLVVAGDGPERPALQRLAADLDLAGRVEFPGRVPDVSPVINRATLVLMPSRWEETFGLVALEAALLGRPVIASRVGALPEVVRHGQTGVLVERDDPVALAAEIAARLGDPEGTRRMGVAARERALRTFDLGRCLDAYEALYQRLVPPPP